MWFNVILFMTIVSTYVQGDAERIVKLRQGRVRGHLDPNGGLYSFYGIPYATAPTGIHKFKAPLPGPAWIDTLDAVDNRTLCPQKDFMGLMPESLFDIKEDCLVANIFVPATKETNLSVVIYVHGGAFVIGYGNWLSYKALVRSKKVIVVTFNYRLGAHGFLCLGTDDVPGNAGMKDQVALLRWVNQNIANFGGNPEEVTIAGYSAGSVSVDLLMLSKSTKGLFKKIIPESGASLAAFSIQTDPFENAKEFARLLNYTGSNSIASLEDFFKNVSYESLTSINVLARLDSTFLMSPCIERSNSGEAFLTDSPLGIIKHGLYPKIPTLYGFTSMEGLVRLPLFDQFKDAMNKNFQDFLPPDLKFQNDEERQAVAQKVKEFYFGNSNIDSDTILEYINYFSDIIFTYPALRTVKYHVEAGHDQIYLYEFSFVHDDLPKIPYTNIRGADHCSQTYIVSDGLNATMNNDRLEEMKPIIRTIWANFIFTGKPIPEDSELPPWPPVGKNWSPHMSIDLPLSLRGSLLKERTLFWDQIYERHYQQPIPPPASPHLEL
ncbi:unnamed protein product [Leptidea sinapis]|uniref:Carboxylic ester hydrolase n=1 Tax=Leptidea sinapis TaxID=189913 RepID=A0A5E4PPM1_9NEOP|nr:unnamed protein product [Leptidea sinapis]